jgi:feruloyl esterase
MKTVSCVLSVLSLSILAPRARVVAAASCESLASIALPHTTITRAQTVPAGQFAGTPAGILEPGATPQAPYKDLPEFCRIAATLAPSNDSEIKIEVWMPSASSWNGKFEAVGNGGWAGQLGIQPLAVGVRRGYAIAATDTGHTGNGGDASFAFNHPEKLTDFAWRAVHEMTVQAKALIRGYYGSPSKTSYWVGCSTGGRQGLKEAQRFPEDFDGIVAGAPANDMTHLLTQSVWVAQAVLKDPASYVPREKYTALHQAVMAACDGLDGVKDGVLEEPTRCRFDPKTIQCAGEDSSSCLTAAQVEAVRKIYGPARNPRTGADLFPGQALGSEIGWAGGLAAPAPLSIANTYWKSIVLKNPDWDFKTLDFDKDVALADSLDHGEMNAIDPDLKAFIGRGGKLLLYHGWNDQLIAPGNSINYYTGVVNALGGEDKTRDSVRLFMMPGVNHCAGGDGPSNFDQLGVMEQWMEQKTTPEKIVASHVTAGAVDRTRPLCPYPQVAVYSGTGDTNKAENFSCKKP